jgi:hypothetical protein
LILRPWFDAVAVRALTRWYLPVSRAWGTGVLAAGDFDRFVAISGGNRRKLSKYAAVLTELDDLHRTYKEALANWEESFFETADISRDRLVASADARYTAATHFMGMRRKFLSLRRSFSQVAWSIAQASEVQTLHGARLAAGADKFPAPSVTPVSLSKLAKGPKGREGWAKMPSPARPAEDTSWAHVFWPEGKPRGTIVSLHGVLMEQDMWPIADPVSQLVEDGFCVVRLEGPWHGRRCPAGQYGGENIFARGLLGFIELFESWVAEVALWVKWARSENGGPVGVSGISLGALTTQLVAANCGTWPREMRPDAVLLITTSGDVADGTLNGSLAGMLNMGGQLADAGWGQDDIAPWRPLLEPGDAVALDPAAIVMALGSADTVTPYSGGKALADQWGVPAENRLVKKQGHFSTALGLYHDRAPLRRLAQVLTAAK